MAVGSFSCFVIHTDDIKPEPLSLQAKLVSSEVIPFVGTNGFITLTMSDLTSQGKTDRFFTS